MASYNELDATLRSDLSLFVRKVFATVSPNDAFKPNWHIKAIAHELTRCHARENRRLLITQPPRSLKSICASVAFPAWALGHDPTQRFLCVSYSESLARRVHPAVPHGHRKRVVQAGLSRDAPQEGNHG